MEDYHLSTKASLQLERVAFVGNYEIQHSYVVCNKNNKTLNFILHDYVFTCITNFLLAIYSSSSFLKILIEITSFQSLGHCTPVLSKCI